MLVYLIDMAIEELQQHRGGSIVQPRLSGRVMNSRPSDNLTAE